VSPGREATVEVDGHRLVLTNLDKVLYPKVGFTKSDLLAYYSAIAPTMLGHLAERPLSVQRFPDGVEGQRFFGKNLPKGAPDWLQSVVVKSGVRGSHEEVRYPIVDCAAALLYFANLAAIELHVPMWRSDPARPAPSPDEIVFDLDPGAPAALPECCALALLLREELPELADRPLEPLPKVSGKKGLQLYCAVEPMEAEAARTLAHTVAEGFASRHPDLAVANMRKDLRGGVVLIDWSQNVPAKTTVAPYSLRPEPEPSVSAPVSWEEVASATTPAGAAALRFGPAQVLARVEAHGDLFAPLTARR